MTRRLAAFALVALLQLGASATTIAIYETTLARGTPLRLRLAPADPLDPLRGYYVALRFQEERPRHVATDADLHWGDSAFAVLERGDDGFAHVSRLVRREPASGTYLKVRVRSSSDDTSIEFPFDRFYTGRESAAAVRPRRFDATDGRVDYAIVHVRDGRGVIAGLVVDGRDVATGRRVETR